MPQPHRFRLPRTIQQVLDWIGSHELHVLIASFVMALTLWGLVEIASEVTEGDTAKFDEWAVRILRRQDNPQVPIGPKWLAEVARNLTALGGAAILGLLTLMSLATYGAERR